MSPNTKGTRILIAIARSLVGFLVTIPQRQIYQAHTTIEILGLNDNFLNQKQVNPSRLSLGTESWQRSLANGWRPRVSLTIRSISKKSALS